MNYMHYRSTRGSEKKTFADILSSGLAADGGLYEPTSWPHHRRLRGFLAANPSFPQVVGAVVGVFAGRRSLPHLDFTAIAHKAFEPFRSRAVIPLREVARNLWLLELFHGPTLSFKDIPLQFYGQLLEALASSRKRLLIMIGATSGDTGSAAIEALKSVRGVRLFMLHPKDRISIVQRKQMTCVQAPHICNIAVEGSYDDCLRLVKTVAQSEAIQARGQVSAVNSFNWVRIAVQSAIYLYAAQQVPRHTKSIRFALASGNFGNAYAGYVAKKLGANIDGLTLAVSHNDFLHTLFQNGSAASGEVVPSLAPSIDIMTPNNIERLLFRSLGDSVRKWKKVREQTEEDGTLRVPKGAMRSEIFQFFRTQRFDDEQILEAMSQAYESVGEPLDPHSAIALKAAKDAILDASRNADKRKAHDLCTVAFATASAAKFPETLERAIGAKPHIPMRLAELETRAEAFETIPADDGALESIIVARLREVLDSDANLQAEEEHATIASATTVAATTVAAATTAAVLATSAPEQSDADATAGESETTDEGESEKTEHSTRDNAADAMADETSTETETTQDIDEDIAEDIDEDIAEDIDEVTSDASLATAPSVGSFSSPEPPAIPEMPAVAALTAEEDSLEKKIAKLKEQTAQLDESLEDPATTSSSALTDSPFATPTSPFDTAPSTSEAAMPSTSAQAETEAWTETEKQMENATIESATIESATIESATIGNESVVSDVSPAPDDAIASLADAAEQGQASLQEKIANLKEQSAKLDEAAETLHSPFEEVSSSQTFAKPSSAYASAEEAEQEATQKATEDTSKLVGAENFFSSPAEATETAEATEPNETPSATPSTTFSWETAADDAEEKT